VGLTLHESFPRQIEAMVPPGLTRRVLAWLMPARDRGLRTELRRFTWLAAISRHVRRRTLAYLGPDAPPTHTVYNTCAEWFTPQSTPPDRRGETLRHLFVGRLSPEKGIDLLVEAFRRTPGPHRLTVVGLAGALVPVVQDAARRDPRIDLRPPLRHEELPAVYHSHDVVWCPSTWEEPFGLTALEGRISGCAVVTTRRGGLPEIIEGYSRGLIVPARASGEFALAVADLAEAFARTSALVATALEGAREENFRRRFSSETFTRRYEALLQGEPLFADPECMAEAEPR
jgi:glycosyltransferase involved in cell wall biosynthesis